MSTYELKLHSRDLAIKGGEIVNHTGYDLIETKVDGSITVHSLDLMDINGKIYITEVKGIAFAWPGDNLPILYLPEKVFFGDVTDIKNPNQDISVKFVRENHFSQVSLDSEASAKETFDKILFDARFRNALQTVSDGLIDYDLFGPNCNTWTNHVAKTYLGQDVLSSLPGLYPGKDMPFNSNTIGGADNRNCKLIEDISAKFFASYSENFNMDNFQITLTNALDTDNNNNNGFYAVISDGTKTYIFDGERGSWFADDDGNIINGTAADDYIITGKGNDTIIAGLGNDIVDAGIIENEEGVYKYANLGAGNDIYVGGKANDQVVSVSGDNYVILGAGSDTYTGGDGVDIVDGGSENPEGIGIFEPTNMVDGADDENTIYLGGGNDKYAGGKGKDIVHTGSGDDEVSTGDGNDEVYTTDTNNGNDHKTINLGGGSDQFHGGIGNDIVDGGQNNSNINDKNYIDLGNGNNTYKGGTGEDYVVGGTGVDEIDLGDGKGKGAGKDTINNFDPKKVIIRMFLTTAFVLLLSGCDDISDWQWETKNHYGPIVDCNSSLPINDLIQCVKDKYVQMDDFYMNILEKYNRKQQKQYSEGKYRTSKTFYFPDTYQNITYKTVSTFHSLKDCYKKDKCLGSSYRDGLGKYNYDEYKKEFSIRHYNSIGLSRIGYDRRGGCDIKRFTTTISRFENCGSFPIADLSTITYKYFTRSYPSPSKDLIIFENNGLNVYAAFFEAVRLKDNKNLIAIRIFEFRPHAFADIIKEKGWQPNGKGGYQRKDPVRGGVEVISEELIKHQLFPYAAFTVWDIRDETIANMDKDFAISLDKRNNPNKIFINMGAKVYEIPIHEKEAN